MKELLVVLVDEQGPENELMSKEFDLRNALTRTRRQRMEWCSWEFQRWRWEGSWDSLPVIPGKTPFHLTFPWEKREKVPPHTENKVDEVPAHCSHSDVRWQ